MKPMETKSGRVIDKPNKRDRKAARQAKEATKA